METKPNKFTKFSQVDDPLRYLSGRGVFIKKSNNDLKELLDKTLAGMEEKMKILYSIPLHALIMHSKDAREKKVKDWGSYYGELKVDVIEIRYYEVLSLAHDNISREKVVSSRLEASSKCGNIAHKSLREFNDADMSWGDNCFFLKKEGYDLFKTTITGVADILTP